MKAQNSKLDNPVWYALSETHREFAIDYDHLKFYDPAYCPFGGFAREADMSYPMEAYATLVDSFFIVGEKPSFPDKLKLERELTCLQMLVNDKIDTGMEEQVIELNGKYPDDLYQLVNLVQPGYFKRKTALLGNYYGIFKNNMLVAVTGEQMKMNGYVEVSAVITHPGHTGKGYAKQLLAHAVNNILNENKTPYLHVVENNTGAIKLYEKLGFLTRRKISFWNVIKKQV